MRGIRWSVLAVVAFALVGFFVWSPRERVGAPAAPSVSAPSTGAPAAPDDAAPPVSVPPGPASPGAAPSAPTVEDRFQQVDAALSDLVAGTVVFNTPERMTLGESHTIGMILSPKLDALALSTELRRRLPGVDPISVQSLAVSPVMEAKLEGRPAFTVTPLNAEVQPVSQQQPTEWRWDVHADQEGTHTLHLTVSAVISVGTNQYSRKLEPALDRDIIVSITARQRLAALTRAYWQWVVTVILIPVGAWAWRRRKRGKDPMSPLTGV